MLDSLTRQPLTSSAGAGISSPGIGRPRSCSGIAKLPGGERDIMHLLFADKAHRSLLIDSDELAPRCWRYFGPIARAMRKIPN